MTSLRSRLRHAAVAASAHPVARRAATAAVALSALDRSAPPALAILTCHRVAPSGERPDLAPTMVSASPARFRELVDTIVELTAPVSLHQVRAAVEDGAPLPPRAALLTFDDAYADFATHAWPVLRAKGVPATMFVATAYPDGDAPGFWWDRVWHAMATRSPAVDAALADAGLTSGDGGGDDGELVRRFKRVRDHLWRLPHEDATTLVERVVEAAGVDGAPAVLSWDDLRALHADGLSIGAHTHTHPLLTKLSTEAARSEIRRSIDVLAEQGFGECTAFAYPGGDHDDRIRTAAAAAGCSLAVTTARGLNVLGSADHLRLRRINVGASTTPAVLAAQLVPSLARLGRSAG